MDENNPMAIALKAMNDDAIGFDVIIICTTDDHQAEFWMQRLHHHPLVLAVSEDWNDGGGAGNGLGTLYAYQKAAALAKSKHDRDIDGELQRGDISAALYHTAGKGTRLAPMPASENNNKPGVKLSFCNNTEDSYPRSLTVLEAVVKQTSIYGKSRKGRLSVFWGDQVFVPSVSFEYAPKHHADILCTLLGDAAPTAREWQDQGLDKYGVIAVIQGDEAAQVEKVSHETAMSMLNNLGHVKQVGPSLGSFSVSASLLNALVQEFENELSEKTAKYDTDPHFWMPLTLAEKDYLHLMTQKGMDENSSRLHYTRMAEFKKKFKLGDSMGLFGAVNVGKDACWWDYGQLKLYLQNSKLLLETSKSECRLLRQFLGVTSNRMNSSLGSAISDETSCVFGTQVKTGNIRESVVAGVRAEHVELDGAIVVQCAAKKIKAGKNAIVYNVVDDSSDIEVGDGDVLVQVIGTDGNTFLLKSRMDIDGGKAWKQVLEGLNTISFEDVHKQNKGANIIDIDSKRQESYMAVAKAMGFE